MKIDKEKLINVLDEIEDELGPNIPMSFHSRYGFHVGGDYVGGYEYRHIDTNELSELIINKLDKNE